jgi:hypothetical protein
MLVWHELKLPPINLWNAPILECMASRAVHNIPVQVAQRRKANNNAQAALQRLLKMR